MRRRGILVIPCLGMLALVALAVTGCDRKPRLIPAEADSTATIPADSMAIYLQMAQERWDSPDQMEDAAVLIARILFDDLRAHSEGSLTERARDFLDSLRTGAEVFGNEDVAIANLFARSNPTGGSWPWAYWRDGSLIRSQTLDAVGMRLQGAAVDASESGMRVAALFGRSGPQGQSPFVFVWQRPPNGNSFRLAQSLGSDSLGAAGTARFVESRSDGVVLVSRTYQIPGGFNECPSCPHIYRTRGFRWGAGGLVGAGDEIERTPYSAFVLFVHALGAGDLELASRQVADRSVIDAATSYQLGQSRGLWRLSPGSAANARELVMLRGSREAYRVQFSRQGEDWVITGLEAANRTIE